MKRYLEQRLEKDARHCQIYVYDQLPSTNTTARELAASGAPDGTVVIAERQSAGRGRMSRSFFSPGGTGLYMSVIIRRDLLVQDALKLTTTAAVAVAQAIESMGKRVGIKWVNDVYLDKKKVCGILTEGAVVPGNANLDYAVIGIGVNVAFPQGGFPEELTAIAGSVFGDVSDPYGVRCELALNILNRLMTNLNLDDSQVIHKEYCRRSFVIGKQVTVHRGDDEPYTARVMGIDYDYRLLIRTSDGREAALDSGEISIRM